MLILLPEEAEDKPWMNSDVGRDGKSKPSYVTRIGHFLHALLICTGISIDLKEITQT